MPEQRSPKAIIQDWLVMYSGGEKPDEFEEEADSLIRWLHDEGWWITSQAAESEGRRD